MPINIAKIAARPRRTGAFPLWQFVGCVPYLTGSGGSIRSSTPRQRALRLRMFGDTAIGCDADLPAEVERAAGKVTSTAWGAAPHVSPNFPDGRHGYDSWPA
jgi:hypothetical protein